MDPTLTRVVTLSLAHHLPSQAIRNICKHVKIFERRYLKNGTRDLNRTRKGNG
ncbi:hypothetical protein HW555_005533 [Spodoptera exigua]|uniref:Uncharacterized protein n=1 Tax=Spodoptera exigua TaxID=7107 RepID=A0A835GGU7_SPOEX|nr:hypothetical protein HW555_005533 [Spodoptera exigua]